MLFPVMLSGLKKPQNEVRRALRHGFYGSEAQLTETA
jgi:hypothetical protein